MYFRILLCTFTDQARNPLAARKTLRQAACPHDQVDRQQNGLAVLPAPVGGDLDWWWRHVGKSQRIIIPGMMEHISLKIMNNKQHMFEPPNSGSQ